MEIFNVVRSLQRIVNKWELTIENTVLINIWATSWENLIMPYANNKDLHIRTFWSASLS